MRKLRKSPDAKHTRYGNVKAKVKVHASEEYVPQRRNTRRDEREVLVRDTVHFRGVGEGGIPLITCDTLSLTI